MEQTVGVISWEDRARYLRVLGELRESLNREMDAVQVGASLSGVVPVLAGRVMLERRRYEEGWRPVASSS